MGARGKEVPGYLTTAFLLSSFQAVRRLLGKESRFPRFGDVTQIAGFLTVSLFFFLFFVLFFFSQIISQSIYLSDVGSR